MSSVPSGSCPLQYPAWFLPVEQCRPAVRAASVRVLRVTREALGGTGTDPWPLQLPGGLPMSPPSLLGRPCCPTSWQTLQITVHPAAQWDCTEPPRSLSSLDRGSSQTCPGTEVLSMAWKPRWGRQGRLCLTCPKEGDSRHLLL